MPQLMPGGWLYSPASAIGSLERRTLMAFKDRMEMKGVLVLMCINFASLKSSVFALAKILRQTTPSRMGALLRIPLIGKHDQIDVYSSHSSPWH